MANTFVEEGFNSEYIDKLMQRPTKLDSEQYAIMAPRRG